MTISITWLKVISIVSVLVITVIGASIPFMFRRKDGDGVQEQSSLLLHLSNHVTSGVFIGAAFLHLLPDSAEVLNVHNIHIIEYFNFDCTFLFAALGVLFGDLCQNLTSLGNAPRSNELKLASAAVAASETPVAERMRRHRSEGSAHDSSAHNRVVCVVHDEFMQYRPKHHVVESSEEPLLRCDPSEPVAHSHKSGDGHHHHFEVSGSGGLPYFIAFLLGFHSLIAGIALGASGSSKDVITLLIAIVAHKWAESFALSLTLTKQNIPFNRSLLIVFFYSAMCPIGIIIAGILTHFMSGRSALITQAVLTAFAAGCFLYIGAIHMLENEYKGPGSHTGRILAQLFGFSIMLVVSLWDARRCARQAEVPCGNRSGVAPGGGPVAPAGGTVAPYVISGPATTSLASHERALEVQIDAEFRIRRKAIQHAWSMDPEILLTVINNGVDMNESFYQSLKKREKVTQAELDAVFKRWPYGTTLYSQIPSLDLILLFAAANDEGLLTLGAKVELQVLVENYDEISSGKKMYVHCINRWARWCRHYSLRSFLVTPIRAVQFIDSECKRPKLFGTGGANSGLMRLAEDRVGTQSLLHTTNALVHLYEIQKLIFPDLEHPRSMPLKMKLNSSRSAARKEMKGTKYDRQEKVSLDIYDGTLRKNITEALLNLDDRTQPLRNAGLWNLSYATASRADWAGKVEFRDAFHKFVGGHGPTDMFVFALVKTHFKNWTIDHPFIVGFTRSKDPTVCAAGLLGLILVEEFHVRKHEPIDLFDFESWCSLKFFYGRDRHSRLSQNAQRKQLAKALKKVGVNSAHVTHLAKQYSLCQLELDNIPDNQALRMACFSNKSVADAHYKNQLLPMDAIRSLAGFAEKGDYYIARQEIPVPKELLNQLFPTAEAALKRLKSDDDCSSTQYGFIKLIIEIRVVVFQDSIFNIDDSRKLLNVYTHPVFHSDMYKQWRIWALSKHKELLELHVPKSEKPDRTFEIVLGLRDGAFRSNVGNVDDAKLRSASGFVFRPPQSTVSDPSAPLLRLGDIDNVSEVMEHWNKVIMVKDAESKDWRKRKPGARSQVCRWKRIVQKVKETMKLLGVSEDDAVLYVNTERLRKKQSLYEYSESLKIPGKKRK